MTHAMRAALLLPCLGAMPPAAEAGNEILMDRCSREVSIVSACGDKPGSNDAISRNLRARLDGNRKLLIECLAP